MITHGVIGGLGNQLYQIFTTIALAMRTGQACVFHRKAEFNVPTNTVRAMHWDTLLSALEPYLRDTDPCTAPANSEFAEGGVYLYHEPGHTYTPIELPTLVPSHKTLYILEGYFQSYKYFEAEFETICTFLKLEEQQARAIDSCRCIPDLQPLVDAYDARRSSGGGSSTQNAAITVAMHFRFGDYKTVSYNHPLLTATYYDRAMAAMLAGENPDTVVHVYLFYNTGDEDDVRPIVAQLKAKYEGPTVHFHHLPPTVKPQRTEGPEDRLTDPEHLLVMSACSHFILANSTYSLWASYFAGYFNRSTSTTSTFAANSPTVWYPSVWFGPGLADKQVHDMFPKYPGWTKVDAS
jgi:hypothetical protein